MRSAACWARRSRCPSPPGQALSQFFGWSWGASRPLKQVPKFTATYTLAIVAAVIILYTGLDPIKITVVSMIFAVMALPFTFLPMLLVANDETYMGDHTRTASSETPSGCSSSSSW